ncbi:MULTISPECIES: SgcJ/EcaC family oxidoreductase [Edwardsiella]|uniref:Calcium/calmodulin-dependent protein kinase II association-domain domain-containing protein n=2 Tax=Edwardsiella anguillarum TaxID=1821960 RepID=A0A076LYG0_9GAMM|nr:MULTISPECIES: SgcJ/EcaC family oxidoreductase [Edwardsiella]AKM47690.1 hypothetical protein QY76_10370 [Edwardsiella sp. EA181011]GAJ68663.1 calcium/calmodulin dependent protein kinase II [Edwardsiella piscicida]AIJ10444.1 Hypothetical protein ETEE_4036 [Edwardsiella anguillarum ET080813]AKR77942.1 SgcJ/EcaC family oxidoreductase [Edwardsiella sp. LADL05-105]KAB0589608.1 SgcJ/EcaC family oxidoreductase [Edwardsiella anguillarum]
MKKIYLIAAVSAWMVNPAFAATEQCAGADPQQIAALFDQWNAALKTGDAQKVVDTYLPDAVLLPTVSDKTRYTQAERLDYFKYFLAKKPVGVIDSRTIKIDCNTATDIGTYTFTFADRSRAAARYTFTYAWNGQAWKIATHHSSLMPSS